MTSMATNPPPAKRRRTTLQPATIEALEEERAEPIEIGTLVLPAGFESACGIMTNILQYLDIRSLCNVKRSSLIQQCRKRFGCDDFERVRDVALRLSEADPNITNRYGVNALHLVCNNGTDTELIQCLLNHMTIESINKTDNDGETPLDCCYRDNDSPIRQEMIALLRTKGGIANNFDENGDRIDSSDDEEEDDY
eukprot:g6853.t1